MSGSRGLGGPGAVLFPTLSAWHMTVFVKIQYVYFSVLTVYELPGVMEMFNKLI